MNNVRREFSLPPGDVEYLDSLGLVWETIVEGPARWLFIHTIPIPLGYNHREARLALRIEPGYPDTQIDMAYFDPPLRRLDGGSIRQISTQQIDGRQFQRWSRHRTKHNPWRPGVDDVSTHLTQVGYWLEKELSK